MVCPVCGNEKVVTSDPVSHVYTCDHCLAGFSIDLCVDRV